MNNTGIKTGGRVKGVKNVKTVDLRHSINSFIAKNFAAAQEAYDKLQPKDQLTFLSQLLKYSLPTLASVSASINFEKMTDENLNIIIEELKNIDKH